MLDPNWANWFTGLVDGEGCFTIALSRERQCAYKPGFALVLRDDDANTVFEILERLKFGVVLKRTFSAVGSKPGLGFYIAAKSDLLKLVEFFSQYPLRSKKAKDYTVWREAVVEYQKPPATRNHAKMEYLYYKLKMVRQYDPPEIEDFEPKGIQLEFWE